jgi:acyl carrier protein
MHDLESRLFTLVQQELGLPPGDLSRSTCLAALGDSLDWVHLMSAVEDSFAVRITPAQSLALVTVGDLVRLLQEPALA